jgi:NAD(P)-dependent dehydrogenase (short-subunit alcohol dehydrogenase family)
MADDDNHGTLDRRSVLIAGTTGLAAIAASPAFASTEKPTSYPWQKEGAGKRFAGKTVLITGATSGIGEATARAFAAEGGKVFFCGRREELGKQVAASIKEAGGTAAYMRADVREPDQVAAFVKACHDTYGGPDIGFNNAGIGGPSGDYAAMALDGTDGYHDVMKTNLDGVFYAVQQELPLMLAQGHGVIINTASMLGSKGSPGLGPYNASKFGVIGLTRSVALRHAKDNIRAISISPGPVDTPLLRGGTGGNLAPLAAANPSKRVAMPEEIAATVLHLASPEAAYINGEDIKIDGGDSA